MTLATNSISSRLKTETRALHTQAEKHPLQTGLVKGTLPRELYIANMGQLLCVHRALESALRAAAPFCDAVRAMIDEACFQAPRLAADLLHFGVDPDAVEPTPATRDLCARIERCVAETPAALIGYLYVLEGSNNGNRFIARAIRKAYGVDRDGATYLDPHGEAQPMVWAAFRDKLDAIDFATDEADAIVAAADDMFRAVSAIADDLMPERD